MRWLLSSAGKRAMILTPKQRRALEILAENSGSTPEQGLTPSEFGALAYPRTVGHVNGPWGLAPHAARSQAAGSVLARLYRRGLVKALDRRMYRIYRISDAGRRALEEDGDEQE